MLLRRSPAERLCMACRVFSSARALARAGMPATYGLGGFGRCAVRLAAASQGGESGGLHVVLEPACPAP